MTNLASNLQASAERFPDSPALRLGQAVLTYRQLDDLSGRAAGRLAALGVVPGDRVGLMLPNVLEFPILFYGALRLGATVVPMNPLLKGRELAHYTSDSGMTLLLADSSADGKDLEHVVEGCLVETVDSGLLDSLRVVAPLPYRDCADDDTALILYTSGTTGTPKGAQLTHGGLRRNVRACTHDLLAIVERDVIMGCLPLFHVFGLTCGLNTAVAAGALLVLIPRFDAQAVLESISANGVTIFEGVPTMYSALAALPEAGPDKVRTLRLCSSGGAALPGEILRTFESKYGAQVLEGYGLSETSPVASFNPVGRSKIGSIGVPIPGVEFKLVDDDGAAVGVDAVGEICIRGHNVMKGYWNRPEATADAIDADGWFHTGDLARLDDDGYYFIVDRKKELIIRGGFNVYPREVEEALYEHPAVREAAVLGLPDSKLGEEVGAAVSLQPGTAATEQELREFVKARVAPYKYPRVIWFLDDLPKGATGKILKRAIERPISSRCGISR